MPETRDMGPFFAHTLNLKPGAPFLHTAPTDELEIPFRRSNSLVVKIWPGKAIVLGRWRHTGRTETEGILTALQGHENALTTDEIRDTPRWDADDLLV